MGDSREAKRVRNLLAARDAALNLNLDLSRRRARLEPARSSRSLARSRVRTAALHGPPGRGDRAPIPVF